MKKLNLTTKILISLVLGIVAGILISQFQLNSVLDYVIKPVGSLFLNLMKMTIIPLILTTLITSMTQVGNMSTLGFLGKKTLLYFICTTLLAAFMAIVLALIFQPGAGVRLLQEGYTASTDTSLVGLLVDMVPTNPFKALTEGNTLQVIVFAAFVGYAINALGDKASQVKVLFSQFADIMFKIIEAIMVIAPIAVFALIADVVATNGWDVLISLIKLILVVTIASIIQVVVVYGGSLKSFTNVGPVRFLKSIVSPGIFAFSTASSAATLPLSIATAEEKLEVPRTISSFVLNLGSTVNMGGGAIYQAACAIFISQIYGVELSFFQLVIVLITASLASIGAAAIPGTVIVMMTMVLSSVGLPLEAIALIAGVDRILDMITTSVNVTGDIAACAYVSHVEKKAATAEPITATYETIA